jgi:hypothetical protein
LNLFGRELLAVDPTRIKAVNSIDRNFTREKLAKLIQSADERLTDYLARLDRADTEEHATGKQRAVRLTEKIAALKERRTRHTALLQELERTGESRISLTDPDSRAIAAHLKVGVGYNVQVAVDAKHKLIVEQQVTNAGSDLGLLAETTTAAKEVLGVDQIDAVADKGYYKGEDIQACEDAGISAYVARPQRRSAVRDGLFRKEEFRYDAASDTFIRRDGATLEPRYRSVVDGHSTLHYCNRDACRSCEIKPRCTSNTYRRIIRWAQEAVLDRMSERVAARPRDVQAAAGDRRTSVRQHQAVDEPGILPDAWGGEDACRVQPDSARL